VRLGAGAAMALSPDRRWALANRDYTTDAPQLVLIPTGAGQPRELPRGNVNTQAATFFPDGRRLLLTGSEPGQPPRAYVQDVEGGAPRPVSPVGTRFALASRPITPDGCCAVLRDTDGTQRLFAIAGGAPRAIAGLEPGEEPIRWAADGRRLFVYRPGELPARVWIVDTQTGRREPWLDVQPADGAGVLAVNPVQLTADGRGYAYGYRRVLSDLYVVSGLR
jgi:dipeptidyl aminopeptidase/acylaminoacyl peptidase